MARKLKVYAWSGFRSNVPSDEDRHGQTREYVAAHSKAEAIRLIEATGVRWRVPRAQVYEATWQVAIDKCMAKPLAVFWHPLATAHRSEGPSWREAAPKGGTP